jgi:hypothetical protein
MTLVGAFYTDTDPEDPVSITTRLSARTVRRSNATATITSARAAAVAVTGAPLTGS